jgi:hypothetical protein
MLEMTAWNGIWSSSYDTSSALYVITTSLFLPTTPLIPRGQICQAYLISLSENLPPSKLSSLSTPTKITVVSCGTPNLIKSYISDTSCPYTLYTDPTQKIYKALNMGRTLDLGSKKPKYMENKSMLGVSLKGIYQGLRAGRYVANGGDFWQVGGEFLFVKGNEEKSEWECKWAHRMRTTRDHAEVDELRDLLGVTH